MAGRDDFRTEEEWMKQKQSTPPGEKRRKEEPKAPEVKDDAQLESDGISKPKVSKPREEEEPKEEPLREPVAEAAEEPRIYVVQKGDSLSKISKEVYGNAGRWREIYEANRDRIENPSLIRPGWKLRIP